MLAAAARVGVDGGGGAAPGAVVGTVMVGVVRPRPGYVAPSCVCTVVVAADSWAALSRQNKSTHPQSFPLCELAECPLEETFFSRSTRDDFCDWISCSLWNVAMRVRLQ